MPDPLDRLVQIRQAATPGPWEWWMSETGPWTVQSVAAGDPFMWVYCSLPGNAAYIAAFSPALTEKLLAVARAAEAIAEGGLGDKPWLANYDRIREFIREPLVDLYAYLEKE